MRFARPGTSARHRRRVPASRLVSRRLALALVLVAAILINVVQFRAIDAQTPRNYQAIYLYGTSDLIDIGLSSARVRERTSMYVALGLIAPGSTVTIPRRGPYGSSEIGIGFHSFGKVSELVRADVPGELPQGVDPMPFVVVRGLGEVSERGTPWAIAVDPSGVQVGDPEDPEGFLRRAARDRPAGAGPPRHFVLVRCACPDGASTTNLDLLIESSLMPTGAEGEP